MFDYKSCVLNFCILIVGKGSKAEYQVHLQDVQNILTVSKFRIIKAEESWHIQYPVEWNVMC